MTSSDKVNVLLVDDQPAKLLAYEVILRELGENLIKASSARQALEYLLKSDVAVILIDVCMPELDGFQLAAMIREHPRFQKTAIIFISAIHLTDVDRLRGYEMGGVDYVPVPVVPEVLRAKVKVFAELYRKTRDLERLNAELESRVAERTAELEASAMRLIQSEQLRSLALAAGQMGSWDWDMVRGECVWDEGQCRIFGVDPTFKVTPESLSARLSPEDWRRMQEALQGVSANNAHVHQTEFRVIRPNGELRWCIGIAAANVDNENRIVRISGVTVDITDRKDAEERQTLLVREVDHRARNALAVVQSIVRLTQAPTKESYIGAVEGRIAALSRAHVLLSESRWEGADLGRLLDEELAPYRNSEAERIIVSGSAIFLQPATAQILALAVHELATNSAKYGAFSLASGGVQLTWQTDPQGGLTVQWAETGGPSVQAPASQGYGTRVISASIERQLGGKAIFDWRPEGLRVTLSIPSGNEATDRASSERSKGDGHKAMPSARTVTGNRLLLVEDEALVGMMMSEMLTELGFQVIGPLASVTEAMAAARREDFHAAVLDVNLDGEMVYPVADAVAARGVPFIFVTGYGSDGIDTRFADIPVLQKPIERQMMESVFVPANGSSPSKPRSRSGKRKDAPLREPFERAAPRS